jgi:predicted RNase H-like HicB family nuclease
MRTSPPHKKRRETDLYLPFNRRSLERGRVIAARYQIKLWREDGEWFGVGVEEPGAMGDGRTLAQCVRSVREALAIAVACHIEDREPIVALLIDRERRRRKAG